MVYDLVRRVPRGRVITYGTIARLLGDPRKAREVGWAMAATPCRTPAIPAHRVINARGEVSGDPLSSGFAARRALLEAEGIVFTNDGRVDLERYLWLPPLSSGSDAAAAEESRNGDQDDRSDDGDDERFEVEAVDHVAAKQHTREPAADQRAQDAEHDVADDAVAAAAHDQSRQPARNETKNNPGNY